MQQPKFARFPKIEPGTKQRLLNAFETNKSAVVIAREKIDGSNFTVFRDDDTLHFYNKNVEIKGEKLKQSVFEYTVEALLPRADIFKKYYTYHCEALRKTRSSHIRYKTIPRYHLICYEIVLPSGLTATQEEMQDILKDTGIQIVHKIWDSSTDSMGVLLELLDNVNNIQSQLGGIAEGFVVSFLNREKKGKITTLHLKFVADHMKERRDLAVEPIGDDFTSMLSAIGDMYNVNPRFKKAWQRLEDQGIEPTPKALTEDLDRDLEEEAKDEILDILWRRCWPIIKRASRAGLYGYIERVTEEK